MALVLIILAYVEEIIGVPFKQTDPEVDQVPVW
jgi:hypothetical protein